MSSRSTSSLWVLVGWLVLGCVAGVGVWFVILMLAAIAGNESFTEGVVRGMAVVAFVVGASVVLIGAVAWYANARSAGRARHLVGAVLTTSALASLAAGAIIFVEAMGNSPVNLAPPKVVGDPRVGNVLRTTPGRWDSGDQELEFEFEWRACRGGDCLYYGESELNGRPREYPVETTDVGRRIVVSVTAYGSLWVDPVESRPTAVVKP